MKRYVLVMIACYAAFVVALAQSFVEDGIDYDIVADTEFGASAKVVSISDASAIVDGVLMFPSIVYNEGKGYTVTEIGNSILPDVSGKVPENTELVEALKGVRSITFPEKLLEIGYGNFNGIALLSEVKFGSYLKEICYGSFNNLKSLENVDFPESLEHIGEFCFSETAIRKLRLSPDILIDDNSFCYMTELSEIDFNGMQAYNTGIFSYNPMIEKIVFPRKVYSIYGRAFSNLESLKAVILPAETDIQIGASAFRGCTHLKQIYATGVTPLKTHENEPLGANNLDYSEITLYVPVGSIDAYKADPVWNVYGTIVEYDPAGFDPVYSGASPYAQSIGGGKIVVYDGKGKHVLIATVDGKIISDAIISDNEAVFSPGKGLFVVVIDGISMKLAIY